MTRKNSLCLFPSFESWASMPSACASGRRCQAFSVGASRFRRRALRREQSRVARGWRKPPSGDSPADSAAGTLCQRWQANGGG
jgi:hypothetical protein